MILLGISKFIIEVVDGQSLPLVPPVSAVGVELYQLFAKFADIGVRLFFFILFSLLGL